MRIYLFVLLALLANVVSMAQQTETRTVYNAVTETLHDVYIAMPDYRQINSGTKLVVTYEGDWPAEMQGAFEHAVRIWEEVLPLSLPISILARVGSYRSLGNDLSMVSYTSTDFQGRFVNDFSCPTSVVKGVCLQEYHAGLNTRFYNEISNTSIFENPQDITITYNANSIDQFDFSLDGNPGIDKYDFVTVALRDIAMGLGFNSGILADPDQQQVFLTDRRPNPFESWILPKLAPGNSKDQHEAYIKGTNGSMNLGVHDLTLYAPSPWINGISLNTFIPSSHPLSRLLCHDFGKGYVMRNLSGCNWNDLFYKLLEWQYEVPVDNRVVIGEVGTSGTSQDIIPYSGTMTIDFNQSSNHSSSINRSMESGSVDIQSETEFDEMDDFYKVINPFCQKFNLLSPNGPDPDYIILCVLKKDGTWDPIMPILTMMLPYEIKIDEIPLNFDEDQYARGTTGGLRYRLTRCYPKGKSFYHNDEYVYSYITKYFTRDYKPQRAHIKYTKSLSSPLTINSMISAFDTDDYFVDVQVGFSNVEGTKKIIVEQLDEGEALPFQYEVDEEEFRKGYFIANLDRECSTQLTVVSYNDNGFQRSNTITIPAIGYPQENLTFRLIGNSIQISGLNSQSLARGDYSYMIQNIGFGFPSTPVILTSNTIYVTAFSGSFILTVLKNNEPISTFKFRIR